MNVNNNLIKSLQLANNANIVTDPIFKNLLENCFSVLVGEPEIHNITKLYNSKPNQIKELYAALLSITAEFVRNNQTKENVSNFLSNQCNYNPFKTGTFADFYGKHLRDIEAVLINIGNYLPHVTNVNWKIDFIIKSSNYDKCEGPLFRIGLQTEKTNNRIEFVNFTCTSQELQDLVYKLKDAVRCCQRIAFEH